jgi:hypothetical protein
MLFHRIIETTSCPTCDAAKGQPCRKLTLSGQQRPASYNHPARTAAFRKAEATA